MGCCASKQRPPALARSNTMSNPSAGMSELKIDYKSAFRLPGHLKGSSSVDLTRAPAEMPSPSPFIAAAEIVRQVHLRLAERQRQTMLAEIELDSPAAERNGFDMYQCTQAQNEVIATCIARVLRNRNLSFSTAAVIDQQTTDVVLSQVLRELKLNQAFWAQLMDTRTTSDKFRLSHG